MSRNHHPFEDDEYTVVPIIPVDYEIHTPNHPFCSDPLCPCHEDPDLLAPVIEDYTNGLLSPDDATRITQGKTL